MPKVKEIVSCGLPPGLCFELFHIERKPIRHCFLGGVTEEARETELFGYKNGLMRMAEGGKRAGR
jgi:hypothetical protein